MRNRGFTLVELLAMMVVLGIIMGVAIPNIMGIMSSQKVNIVKTDADKMVESAKMKMASDKTVIKPTNGKCIVFSLNNLNSNQDINSGPDGKEYLKFDSFVVVKRNGSKFEYYVRLVEEANENDYYGVDLVNINSLTDNDVKTVTTISTNESEQLLGQQTDKSIVSNIISNAGISCTLDNYYPGPLK